MQLVNDTQPQTHDMRFGGIARLMSPKNLDVIAKSRVLIVGIGGVGSWVAESLARTGVGHITLVDLDDVCITNTNRQLLALNSTIGKPKVQVMKERIFDIAPEIDVNAILDFFTKETAEDILFQNFDMIIDCIDSIDNKCLLIDMARSNSIPIITIGGAGGKIDPTLIRSSDLSYSSNDTLLKRVRRTLKMEWNYPRDNKTLWNVQAVYSIERARYLNENGQLEYVPDLTNRGINCATGIGTVSWLTGSFAFTASALAIQTILKNAR